MGRGNGKGNRGGMGRGRERGGHAHTGHQFYTFFNLNVLITRRYLNRTQIPSIFNATCKKYVHMNSNKRKNLFGVCVFFFWGGGRDWILLLFFLL